MTPRVAVGAEGTMAVSWVFQDPSVNPARDSVQVAVKPAGSSVWTTSTLATFAIGGVSIDRSAPVAIDAGGNVTAAWNVWDGARNVVQTATRPKGHAWSTTTTLSGPGIDGLYLSLAVNARGDAAVVYSLSPYSGYLSGTWAEYVFRASGGAWTSPMKISETIPSSVGYVTNPQVALAANGLATVIYMGSGLETTRQLADGTWTTTPAPVITSSVPGASFLSPDLAVDASGNAIAAVSIFDPTINVDRASVWVVSGTPDGRWSTQLRLTDPTIPVDAYATRVAMAADGGLSLVGWIDHYHGTVQVSRFANGRWGAAATIGKGTAWSSFQEVLGLDAGSSTAAQAIWKNAKAGTQTMASTFKG
jgi:hypothetical protein